jgi:Flp pilus assembly protein TadD
MDAPGPLDLDLLLSHDVDWSPPPGDAAAWSRHADATPDAPEALRQEVRWWRALAAGRAGDWAAVSALAEAGLAEPFSVRESARLAFLHCLSGRVEEAEHVISQAVQLHGEERLPARMAAWCEREGLVEAARRLR